MGTSAQIIESQLSQITSQLSGKHEFFYLNGEVESEPAPGESDSPQIKKENSFQDQNN